MILSNQGIKQALKVGEIPIEPPPEEDQYTTSAVDLFIGSDFRCWDHARLKIKGLKQILNLAEQSFQITATAYLKELALEKDGTFIFPPYTTESMHVLGISRERVNLKLGSRIAARVEGRSSLARLGLLVHLTAPTIHAGFAGNITLEMINHGPFYLQIVPNKTRICQLIFERLESSPEGEISTAFQGQTKPTGTR
ncbi:MAG TPA: dCTP deaminase [Candidatus Acidoferrum sp.]|nr:dCTP deaminase [Candidatus Acidoferrum sp.]